MRKLAATLALAAAAIPATTWAYSYTASDVEELAGLSACAAKGRVVFQRSFARGNGIFTVSKVALERRAGACGAGGELEVEEYGGRLPNGDFAGVAGLEQLQLGTAYVLLLSHGKHGWESTEGPQGAFVIDGEAGVISRDLTGQALAEAASKAAGSPRYSKPLAESGAKAAGRSPFADDFFDYVAPIVAGNTPEKASRAMAELRRRLGVAEDIDGESPLQVAKAAFVKYDASVPATGAAFNVRSSLAAEFKQAVTDVFAEWSKHVSGRAAGSVIDDGYGINGRNDIAGFISNATSAAVYGRNWASGELGVTIIRTGSESDVLLNAARSWSYDDYEVRWGRTSAYSVPATLAHEVGHAIGLGHSATMALMTACDTRKGWLPWPDDISGIRARWPGQAINANAVSVRLLYAAGTSCSHPNSSRTTLSYDASSRVITVGPYTLTNSGTAATNVAVDWWLKYVCAQGVTCPSDITLGSNAPFPSVTAGTHLTTSGITLNVPAQVTGEFQVYAKASGFSAFYNTEGVPWTFTTAPVHHPAGDLNGDKKSDILWYNTSSGHVYRMLMNGSTITGGAMVYQEPNLAWRPFGEGDMYANGSFDLLWRKSSGEIYNMPFDSNGLAGAGSIFMTVADANWKLLGSAGIWATQGYTSINSDLLWWNSSSGQVWMNTMSGPNGTWYYSRQAYVEPDTNWRPVGIGDFAGSGRRRQILWRHSVTGSVYMQTINFVVFLSINRLDAYGSMIYEEPDTRWKIVGIGDFNADARDDIVWRNDTTGAVFIMLMQDTAIMDQGVVYSEPNLAWKIVAIGDYDGDGKDDLLWRNDSSGEVYLMRMDGLRVKAGSMIYTEPNAAWRILGLREYGSPIGAIGSVRPEASGNTSFKGLPVNPGRIRGDVLNPNARIEGAPVNPAGLFQ